MILCNVMAIAIGKATIKYPSEGGALPNSSFFGGMSMGPCSAPPASAM